MSSPCWSLPHLLSSSIPQHAAPAGQRDLLQEDTEHQEPLSQEPLPKTSANAIRSESNAKESLSHLSFESAGNLRPNTPTSYEPKRAYDRRDCYNSDNFWKFSWKTFINYMMYRENLENKINKLQLLKRRRNLDTSRHKAHALTRWPKCHPLRRCPTSSPRCTSPSRWKAMRTLISKMERHESCSLHH